jgi:hypothetical protein
VKRLILFHACGLLLAIGCGWLTWCSFWINPYAIRHEVYLFLFVMFIMSAVYAVAAYVIAKQLFSIPLKIIVFWAVVFRILLLPSLPILETDWNRYLWDGFVSSQGINPFQYSPALFLNPQSIQALPDDERSEVQTLLNQVRYDKTRLAILHNVNNAEVNTIYPPMVQWLFMVTALIHPFSIIAWRFVILLFDGLLIFCIAQLLKYMGMNPSMVIFYAWSPLVLKEYINTAHFDGIALSLLFCAIWLNCCQRHVGAAVVWAAAVLVKFFPVAAVLFWMPLKQWKLWVVFFIALIAISYPFYGGETNFVGYAHFVQRWESNSSLVALMEWGYGALGVPAWNEGIVLTNRYGVPLTFDAFFLAKCTGVFFVGVMYVYCWRKHWNDPPLHPKKILFITFILVGGILICSPVANPWYIAWVTPFLCFYPSVAWFYLTTTCCMYYTFFIGNQMGYPPYIRELEYVPFFVLLLIPRIPKDLYTKK